MIATHFFAVEEDSSGQRLMATISLPWSDDVEDRVFDGHAERWVRAQLAKVRDRYMERFDRPALRPVEGSSDG